ncbi:hypothetical protein AX17_006994 [Amanita inopinata Kibby_2008]|nr:hypothetical protein AX17_006994 [Amanita inopinata Kibby_2008]
MDTRPPPPQGPPPSYAFVTRMYKSSLRPVVTITTAIGAIWSIASSIGYFRNYGVDRTHDVPKLAMFCIVLGALYMGAFVIELFGFLSTLSNRTPLVRTYAYLSVLSALIIIATGLLTVVVHFMLKDEIIGICSQLLNGDELVYFGFFGPISHQVIDQNEANAYCHESWSHDSWADIISFLLTSFFAIMFSAVAFSYLHQLLDPSSPANAARAPSSQVRTGGYPSYYNPPYNHTYNTSYAGGPTAGGPYNGPYDAHAYNYQPYYGHGRYAPPPGPPPQQERDEPFVPPQDGKPPSYSGGDGSQYHVGDTKDEPFTPPGERDVTSRPAPGESETFR